MDHPWSLAPPGRQESHNENEVSRDGNKVNHKERRFRRQEKLGTLRLSLLSVSSSASQVIYKGGMLRTSQSVLEDLQQWRKPTSQKGRTVNPETGKNAGSVNALR